MQSDSTHDITGQSDQNQTLDYRRNPTQDDSRLSKQIASIKGKKLGGKWKGKKARQAPEEGESHLLSLPPDLLYLLLSRLPPRALLTLSATCKELYLGLKDDAVWRESYINRFMFDGAAAVPKVRDDVKVLVQGCKNTGSRGWRKEALSREAMLDRWTGSKAAVVTHYPLVGIIDALSLSYPPFIPSPKSLVVGKTHQTPTKAGKTSPIPLAGTPETPEMTHRAKYEALLAATTRPPPYILSAGLEVGGVVKSDPFNGKVSKGFWGPGRDANLQLRPHIDVNAPPSSIYLPVRSQSHLLWGLLTGSCVHTTILSRQNATHGGRASSINVYCEPNDAHEGAILDIWMPEDPDDVKWVTAGSDGRVKYWQLHRGVNSGKRTPDHAPGSIVCLFTSVVVSEPLPGRSEAIKRRQVGKPDDIIFARCDTTHNVICGVTEDGDLRVWHEGKDVRLDVGPAEVKGGVCRLELDVTEGIDGIVASVLVHHWTSPTFTRYDIILDGQVSTKVFKGDGTPLTYLAAYLKPTLPISLPKTSQVEQTLEIKLDSPIVSPPSDVVLSEFGRFVVGGDDSGRVSIWSWGADSAEVRPLRSWQAMSGRITSIDVSCGLVAVGGCTGMIKIFDPLPSPPELLRTFPGPHLSPADQLIASSSTPESRYFHVNHIILENDLVVASFGRRVSAWRAGSTKTRSGGKELSKRSTNGRGDFKGNSRGLDVRALNQDAFESHSEIQEYNSATRVHSRQERQHLAAMEDLGLEDGDEALQYALMISQDDQGGSNHDAIASPYDSGQLAVPSDDGYGDTWSGSDGIGSRRSRYIDDEVDYDVEEAVRAVEEFQRREEEEMSRVLEQMRVAEGRDSV